MLKVLQINVNRSSPATESALNLAIQVNAKIIAIQEPWLLKGHTYENTRSIAHQDFTQILPTYKGLRPRTLFYIRKDIDAEVNPYISDDNDLQAITILSSSTRIYIYNIYNEKSLKEGLNKTTIQRRLLKETLQPSSIILGDFNTHHPRWSLQDKNPNQEAEDLVEWVDNQNLSLLNTLGTGTFFRVNMRQESVLDLTFATNNIAAKIQDWQTIPGVGSDHHAILFSIESLGQLPSQLKRFNIKKTNWDIFNNTLNEEVNNQQLEAQLLDLPHTSSYLSRKILLGQDNSLVEKLEKLGEDITTVVQTALKESTPLVSQKPKPKPWWTSELDNLKSDQNRAFRVLKREASREDNSQINQWKKEYLIAKYRYLKAIKKAKLNHWETFLQKETPKEIFKAMAYTKDNLSIRIPAIKGKETFREKCQAFREDLFPPPPSTPAPLLNTYKGDSRWEWPALTKEELEFACVSVKATSPGPDLISQDIVQKVYQAQPELLFKIYSALFNFGYQPKCWRKAKGVILKKPGKPDYSIPKAYRVISLLSCLGKVLERLFARRLGALAETTDLLHPTQLGGRLKKSAIDAALLFYNNIQQQKKKYRTTTTIFLDIKGAFDHVAKNKLLENMKDQGLPCCLLSWTKSFLENRLLELSFDGQVEDLQEVNTSTP